MDLEVNFPDTKSLINQLVKTSSYKDLSKVYPESAKKAIELIAEFFTQKKCSSNCNFRSEIDEKLSELIDSKALEIRDNLEEGSIADAFSKAFATVALVVNKNLTR